MSSRITPRDSEGAVMTEPGGPGLRHQAGMTSALTATRKGAVTAGQASAGTVPGAPGRTREFKAELNGLRARMRHLGLGHEEIAAEIGRRHAARPREAYRLAWGWTMDEAAARFNEHAARVGTDPAGRASMTGPHLCEYEKWPASTRRPSVYVLYMLAGDLPRPGAGPAGPGRP